MSDDENPDQPTDNTGSEEEQESTEEQSSEEAQPEMVKIFISAGQNYQREFPKGITLREVFAELEIPIEEDTRITVYPHKDGVTLDSSIEEDVNVAKTSAETQGGTS